MSRNEVIKQGLLLENCKGRHLLFLSDMGSDDVLSNLQASKISVVGIITTLNFSKLLSITFFYVLTYVTYFE
jgi:hypothetical protein